MSEYIIGNIYNIMDNSTNTLLSLILVDKTNRNLFFFKEDNENKIPGVFDYYLDLQTNQFYKIENTKNQFGGDLEYKDKFHKYYHLICDPTSLYFHNHITRYFSRTTRKKVQELGHEQFYKDMYEFYNTLEIPQSSKEILENVKDNLEKLLNDLNLCFDERMVFTFSILNYLDEAHDRHYRTLAFRIKIVKILLDKIKKVISLENFGNEKWLWKVDSEQFSTIENSQELQDRRIELFNKMPYEIRKSITSEEKNRIKFKKAMVELQEPLSEIKLVTIDKFKPPLTKPIERENPWKRTSSSSLESLFSKEEFPYFSVLKK